MLRDYGQICDPETGAGFELWNNARTHAYANKGLAPGSALIKGCSCDTLETALLEERQAYETPGLGDVAPWFDPGDCDSGKFAGILMLDIEGLDDAAFDRQVIGNLSEGAAFGPLRRRHKVFKFRALLVGSDHCGVNYGLNWLKQRLSDLPSGCDLAELNMFECCPCDTEVCPGHVEYTSCKDKYERTFKKVALLDGPKVTRMIGSSCGCGCGGCSLMEVTWTFGIGLPYKFRNPNKVINGITAKNFPVKCVEWFKTDEDCACGSVSCSTCGDGSPRPPSAPSIATGGSACSQPIVYGEECFLIPHYSIPDTGESVVNVDVENASGEAVYGVSVTVIPNPAGLPCSEMDECDACATVYIDCVPPYSTYKLDGTLRQANIVGPEATCSTPAGTGCFPVLDPCIDHCVCVRIAGVELPPNVKISVSLVAREN